MVIGERPEFDMRLLGVALAAGILACSSCARPVEPVKPQTLEQLAKTSLSQIDGRVSLAGLKAEVEVLRDEWGVPHIYARNVDDLFFAQGFVVAQDRLWQMEMWRRTGEGRIAEVVGPAGVPHDRVYRLLKFRAPVDDAEWNSYHPEGKRIFTGEYGNSLAKSLVTGRSPRPTKSPDRKSTRLNSSHGGISRMPSSA